MGSGSAKRDVEWSASALQSYGATLHRIRRQAPHTEQLVRQRVSRALDAIALHPGIGTPLDRRGTLRRFPIPQTGHLIEYRIKPQAIAVVRWARQVRR